MNKSEVLDILESVKQLGIKAKRVINQIKELEYSMLPSGIRYDRDKISSSGGSFPSDKLIDTIDKISRLQAYQNKLFYKRRQAAKKITEMTENLPEKEKTVILQFYIYEKSIRDIAKTLGVSERHTMRLKMNAINMLCQGKEKK